MIFFFVSAASLIFTAMFISIALLSFLFIHLPCVSEFSSCSLFIFFVSIVSLFTNSNVTRRLDTSVMISSPSLQSFSDHYFEHFFYDLVFF